MESQPRSAGTAGGTPASVVHGSSAAGHAAGAAAAAVSSFNYVRGRRLGPRVFLVTEMASGRLAALKVLDLPAAAGGEGGGELRGEALEEELRRWADFRHPHLVAVLGHELTAQRLHVHLEYMSGGSVAGLLAEFGPLRGEPLRRAVRGCLEALLYLHTREPSVAHGNIKGTNILTGPHFRIKLADYRYRGLAGEAPPAPGSLPWAAPEVLRAQAAALSPEADVWSLGCTVIEMASAEKPWGAEASPEAVTLALQGLGPLSSSTPPIPLALPGSGRDLVQLCLQRERAQRARVPELLQHDFLDL